MGDIVETGDRVPKLPTFAAFETVTSEISSLYAAWAEAREPTLEMLRRFDQAIVLARDNAPERVAASEEAWPGIVASYLGVMMKAYANSGLQDARVFGRLMRDDVVSIAPPIAAVEIACRRWRQKSKFLPAISELLHEVMLSQAEIKRVGDFIERMPALRARMARDLGVD